MFCNFFFCALPLRSDPSTVTHCNGSLCQVMNCSYNVSMREASQTDSTHPAVLQLCWWIKISLLHFKWKHKVSLSSPKALIKIYIYCSFCDNSGTLEYYVSTIFLSRASLHAAINRNMIITRFQWTEKRNIVIFCVVCLNFYFTPQCD